MSLGARRTISVLQRARPSICPSRATRRSPPPPSQDLATAAAYQRRHVHLPSGVALAPVVFSGLFVALWTWKCCMMVVFQNKIIYMPGMPPNARWERIDDYAARCAGVRWREERVRAADGTNLALCVTDVDIGRPPRQQKPGDAEVRGPVPHFYVLYFQGNASSIPPRLPDLSSALTLLQRRMRDESRSARLTFVCLSYRGYWTSRGRPTERGIRIDSAAALDWISRHHASQSAQGAETETPNTTAARVILWGQSIGAGVATNLAAEHRMPENLRLDSLILETPFTNIRAMLEVLYPQKWLPYKYLWPFLRNHLDSWKNVGIISEMYHSEEALPSIFILEAAKDEIVPAELSQKLHDRAVEVGFPVHRAAVGAAYHNDTMFRGEGRRAVSEFISKRIEDSHTKE